MKNINKLEKKRLLVVKKKTISTFNQKSSAETNPTTIFPTTLNITSF